jgi:Rrf2 family protein
MMPMIYSNACEYAIRALTHLAIHPQEKICKEIAAKEAVPFHFLGKILQNLVRARLLESAPGPRGGFTLARSPDQITLYEIKAAVDGTQDLYECAVGLEQCSDEAPCALHETWKPLRVQIERYLQKTTLADSAAAVQKRRRYMIRS